MILSEAKEFEFAPEANAESLKNVKEEPSDLIGFVFRMITLTAVWRKGGGGGWAGMREPVRRMWPSSRLQHSLI